MDVKLCSRLWWHLIAWLYKGYSRQSFVMFSVGLSCFWVRMKLYTYVVCSLYVFQFWRSWPVLLGYTCLTSVCTVFHRGGNSRSVIFGYINPQLSLYLDLDDHVPVLCSAQVACRNYCEPSYCGYCLRLLYMGQFCGRMVLQLVGILPLFSGNMHKHSRLLIITWGIRYVIRKCYLHKRSQVSLITIQIFRQV